MGAKFIEIPINHAELRIKGTDRLVARLEPELIGPYTEATIYADTEAYMAFTTFSILFRKQQTNFGYPMNLSDWSPIMDTIRKQHTILYLITPSGFDNIKLTANSIQYNPNIDMFEFRGTVIKEEEK